MSSPRELSECDVEESISSKFVEIDRDEDLAISPLSQVEENEDYGNEYDDDFEVKY